MTESGMPGFDFSVWYGLLAPAGTPKIVKEKLAQEVGRILALQEVKDRLLTLGATPRPSTPAEFDQLVRGDVVRMAKLIKDVGIPTE